MEPVTIHAKGMGEDMTLQFVAHSTKGDMKIDIAYKGYRHTMLLRPTGKKLRIVFSEKF